MPDSKTITVQQIFYYFGLLYQHAWTNQLKNPTWTHALKAQWQGILEKLSSADIQLALSYLQSPDNQDYCTFPPKPLEFLQLPKKIRQKTLPSETICYQAAIHRHWNVHPIIRPIAEACNVYWLCHQASDTEGRERFAKHYAQMVPRFLAGQCLYQPLTLPISRHRQQTQPSGKLTAFQTIHQRADRVLAMPNALKKIRSAKSAKEKMAICSTLLASLHR